MVETAGGSRRRQGGTVNSRERFHATFHYERPDRTYLLPQWHYHETLNRWYEEGFPRDADHRTCFGHDLLGWVPIVKDPLPALKTTVIERAEGWEIVEDEFGGLVKQWPDRETGTMQWLRYMVRDRAGWERLRERLDPDDPARYPETAEWEQLKAEYRTRNYPLGIDAGSYYGLIRNWGGMEHLALWYFDCPDLVHEMTDYIAEFTVRTIRRALDEIPDIDFALIWEDMAMKTGPLISPKLFREFMMEPTRRVTKVLRDYGIDIIMVDCDGNVDELIPLWLEAGVNLVYPMEVAAGCDVVRYRKEFGRDLLMIGGIDKRVLRDGCTKDDIRREVMTKVPRLVNEGGYSPFVDHAVPPDVPYENFRYYMELINEVCAFG